jgi:hypothetical protein
MATKKSTISARSYSLISDRKFQEMYAAMVALRTHAKRRSASRGAEASIVGSLIDLRPGDLIVAPANLFPEALLVNERLHLLPARRAQSASNGIPVIAPASASAVLTIAAGAALGRHTAANESVVVAFGTTDAANTESWSEALRLAGRYKLPILFVLLPGDEKEAAFIGSEGASAGVITIPVDTADVVAMYRVAFESLARARRRTSTALIISTSYKLENEKPRRAEDPLKKLETYLKTKGISTKAR